MKKIFIILGLILVAVTGVIMYNMRHDKGYDSEAECMKNTGTGCYRTCSKSFYDGKCDIPRWKPVFPIEFSKNN